MANFEEGNSYLLCPEAKSFSVKTCQVSSFDKMVIQTWFKIGEVQTHISSLAGDEWQHVGEASVAGEGADRHDAAAVVLDELGQEGAQHPHLREEDGNLKEGQ